MRPRPLLLALAAAVAACGATPDDDEPTDAAPPDAAAPDAPPPVTVAPEATLLPAADPKLPGFDGWPLGFLVASAPLEGLRCRVELTRADVTLATVEADVLAGSCHVRWDGRAADGAWLPTGPLVARATVLEAGTVAVATVDAPLEIVRLGIVEVQVQAAGGTRVPLLWAEMAGEAEGYYEVAATRAPWRMGPDGSEPAGAVRLELADGTPREPPAIWTDLKSPPLDAASPDGAEADTHSYPVALVAGSPVDLVARLSSDVAGTPGGGAPQTVEIEVVPPPGTTPQTAMSFAHGLDVTVRTDAPPVAAVGRADVAFPWSFRARRAGGEWVAVPGAVETALRFYGLVGPPVFDSTTLPHRAWVEVVHTVATWVDGASADPAAVAARIVEGVYFETGLVYDVESGASAYTEYPGWSFSGAVFYVAAFQRRAWGSVINCSDAASIVSGYANMMGIDLRYHILQAGWGGGFDLNYIKAIGTADFDETPFLNGGGSFSYHAVVGPADGTVYDATLALDGDGDPMAPPHTPLLASGMLPLDYLRALSSEWDNVDVDYDEKVRLQ